MNNHSKTGERNRRQFLSTAGKTLVGAGFAGAAVTEALAAPVATESCENLPVDTANLKYSDNFWNRDAYARMVGDLDFGKQKFGWFKGDVLGVRPGERVRKLFGFEGFSYARLKKTDGDQYEKLLREVGFYTDPDTGDVLEEYRNPYTDELVKVVPIANDPFNQRIGPVRTLGGPSYGGLNKAKRKTIPFLLPWQEVGNNKVLVARDIHLFYPSALQPEKWPRESSGKMNRVSEMFTFTVSKSDLANPDLTSIEHAGSWYRITPWLPWMLMGQAEGHCQYNCVQGAFHNTDMLSPKVRAYAEKHYPKYFEAPEEWIEPSLSSLEWYSREQTPAPVRE